MVDRISTAGALLQDISLIQSTKSSLDELQFRLATGRKYRSLKNYGNDATRIVDLQRDVTAREAYMRSIDLTSGITGSYDAVLDRLAEVATEIIDTAQPLDVNDPSFLNDTQVVADNLMLEVQANLNVRIGDRYIFAGTNFDTEPVVDIRNLDLYNATDIGVANADEAADDVPTFTVDQGGAATDQSYHTSGAGNTDAGAWRTTSTTINDKQPLDYGITATDPAFQQLVEALIRLKSATQTGLDDDGDGDPTDERRALLGEAQIAAENARTAIRQLQSQNGAIIKELDQTKALHKNFINISQTALDEIRGADTAQAAVEISALQNQLQASFTTIARRNQLSLVNFLN